MRSHTILRAMQHFYVLYATACGPYTISYFSLIFDLMLYKVLSLLCELHPKYLEMNTLGLTQ